MSDAPNAVSNDPWIPGGSTDSTDASQAGGESEQFEAGSDTSGGFNITDRLFSTQPHVDIAAAGEQFNTDHGWQSHLSAFVQKFAGSEGTTAVEHLILAVVLYAYQQQAAQQARQAPENDAEQEEQRADGDTSTADIDGMEVL
jgi:hypothetical protein